MIELLLGIVLGYVFRDFIAYAVKILKKGIEKEKIR